MNEKHICTCLKKVIAGCLSEEEIMGLKELFKGMDTDNSGTITLEELKQGLSKSGTKLTEYEVQQLMEAADADGNGTIDYEEFITATMHMNRMDREEHLYTAFQYFDKDNSGYITYITFHSIYTYQMYLLITSFFSSLINSYITIEELEQALKEFGMGSDKDIKEIVSEVDSDNVRSIFFLPNYLLYIHSEISFYLFFQTLIMCRMVGSTMMNLLP